MRRLAIVLMSCVGLTLALVGPAAAKPRSLDPLEILSIQAVPVLETPGFCEVSLTWTEAPAAPKGYAFLNYEVAVSTTPGDWEGRGAYIYSVPERAGGVVKTKGKVSLKYTPRGAGSSFTC